MRSLGGSYRGRDELLRRVKDEEGMIIGDEEMVVDRWKRYFAGLGFTQALAFPRDITGLNSSWKGHILYLFTFTLT